MIELGENIPLPRKSKTKAERTTIIVDRSPEIGPTGFFVGHNGRGYWLRAGEEVSVPQEVIDKLDHAVMSTPVLDPGTQQVVGYESQRRYNYRVVSA